MMKVYTKTGDDGTTSLVGGERVSKDDPRVEAYGSVDELAAHIALLGDFMSDEGGLFEEERAWIDEIQRDLMLVEARLAGAAGDGSGDAIERLEGQIDRMSEGLPTIRGFIIPGGHKIVSQSHVCRTVCRRAERRTITASKQYPLPQDSARYLNRLSDWLYVVGRKAVEKLILQSRIYS